mgnify:CR=1 FL=1
MVREFSLKNVIELTPSKEDVELYDSEGKLWLNNPDKCCNFRKVKILDNIYKELYKRFIVPIFIPILIIISLLLILNPKENVSYNKNKILIFLIGFLLIVFSESSIKFIDKNIQYNAMVSVLPIFIALVLYSLIRIKLRVKK